MAKDIRECLLEQVGKFHQWQEDVYKRQVYVRFIDIEASYREQD